MLFIDLPLAASVFLDANILVYHFGPHPTLAPACQQLLQRIGNQELRAFTSTAALSDAAHRLMTIEAAARFGWTSKVVQRLKQHPGHLRQLTRFRQAVEEVPQLGIHVLAVPADSVAEAAAVSQQTGLLSDDALIVAVMRHFGLANLASHDADFDRVPGLTRYAPL